MKVLVTGFDPFGGEKVNPSWKAIEKLPDEIGRAEIIKEEIPTVFKESIQRLEELITLYSPEIVICVGQAGGRYKISIERVAINLDDARIPDNKNQQPIDERIYTDGENAYFSTLPIKAMVKEIKKHSLPSEISNSAGTFVCNHLMYGLLYLIDKNQLDIRGGFIHVPFVTAQVVGKRNIPYMALEEIKEGLYYAIEGAIKHKKDIKETGGKIC